jgi:hypothetical protein
MYGTPVSPNTSIQPGLTPSEGSIGQTTGFAQTPERNGFVFVGNSNTALSGGSARATTLPWGGGSPTPVDSAFYPYLKIDPQRWNQLFPYRLLVIDTSQNNKVVNGVIPNSSLTVKAYDQGTSTISFTPTGYSWIFSLQITPQQLSIVDQYAINTSATLRGILEEHNGIKFKMISASGTMGVWPSRSSVSKPPQSPNVLQSVFGGTISAVQGLVLQAQAVVNTFTTNSPNSKPITPNPLDSGFPGPTSTGYYQALALQQFLEQYSEAKKNPANASWRLVFDIPKQNQSFVVTPMQFTWNQSSQKPMEIQYQLQFKAWRRISLNEIPQEVSAEPYTITPGILQRVLNTITEARLTMSSAIGVIGAVTSDVNGVFSVLSQTALFVKDALGVVTAASDLPASVVKDFNSAIQQFVFTNSSTVASNVTTSAGAAAVTAIVAASTQRNGITQAAATNGQLGNSTLNAQQTNPAAAIFNNSNANIDLLDQVPTNQLVLNTAQQNKLNTILSNTTLTVKQLNNNAASILALVNQLENYFGAGTLLYSQLFNLTPPPVTTQQMSIPQFLILDTLYEFLQSIYILTATTQVTDNNIEDSLNYVAGLATLSDIPFTVPTAKVIVPVPSSTTIEAIAARYLGDPNRWLEIAALNKLQEPYLDYSGFQLPLISNAIGRQAVVSSNQNLFLDQIITFIGNGQIQQSRHITNMVALPNGNYLLTVDGLPNLDNFTTSNSAYIQAYLPGTVNAMQKIYIPSDLSPSQLEGQVNVILPETVQNSGDPLAQVSGVDWLINPETGDIVIDQFGNFQLAYGMTNIIQWLYILFQTVLNSFLIHPEFGLGVAPGVSIADIDLQQLYAQINQQITNDPRFSGVTNLQLQANPPYLGITLGIQVAGTTGVFPVSFSLAA